MKTNRSVVFNLIIKNPNLTQTQLATLLKGTLTMEQVHSAVNGLEKQNKIKRTDHKGPRGGTCYVVYNEEIENDRP